MIPRYHSVRATAQSAYDKALINYRKAEEQINVEIRAGKMSQEEGEEQYTKICNILTLARNAMIDAERLYPTRDEVRRRDARLEAYNRGWRD